MGGSNAGAPLPTMGDATWNRQACLTSLARMEAMASARTQIERQLSRLQASQKLVRQEEITEEIIELAAGAAAARR